MTFVRLCNFRARNVRQLADRAISRGPVAQQLLPARQPVLYTDCVARPAVRKSPGVTLEAYVKAINQAGASQARYAAAQEEALRVSDYSDLHQRHMGFTGKSIDPLYRARAEHATARAAFFQLIARQFYGELKALEQLRTAPNAIVDNERAREILKTTQSARDITMSNENANYKFKTATLNMYLKLSRARRGVFNRETSAAASKARSLS